MGGYATEQVIYHWVNAELTVAIDLRGRIVCGFWLASISTRSFDSASALNDVICPRCEISCDDVCSERRGEVCAFPLDLGVRDSEDRGRSEVSLVESVSVNRRIRSAVTFSPPRAQSTSSSGFRLLMQPERVTGWPAESCAYVSEGAFLTPAVCPCCGLMLNYVVYIRICRFGVSVGVVGGRRWMCLGDRLASLGRTCSSCRSRGVV